MTRMKPQSTQSIGIQETVENVERGQARELWASVDRGTRKRLVNAMKKPFYEWDKDYQSVLRAISSVLSSGKDHHFKIGDKEYISRICQGE
jgi:hypothetical protein